MKTRTIQYSVFGVAATLVLGLAGSAVAATDEHSETAVYVANLQPLNTGVTGLHTQGKVTLTKKNGTLNVVIKVDDAPPDMVHWQHFHGFPDGSKATCATGTADVNGDGIVDLIETEPASGTTMVPFDKNPAAMDVAHGSYPKASKDGSYTYRQTIPLEKLQKAFNKAFKGKLDLAHRVVYIHGVPKDTDLPESVASLGPIPAQVTLPIACGELKRVK